MKIKTPLTKVTLAAAFLLAVSTVAHAGERGWTTNYAKALDEAKSEDKAVLLDFTGSDWCEWCMKMKKETLDTPAFKDYAARNLVLVEVDFPQMKPQSGEVKAQNQQLAKQFKADGYPTFVILDDGGNELGRQVGYLAGGPGARFIAELKTFYKGSPNANATPGDDFDSFFKKPAQSATP